jgi:hypothetical protein
MRIVKGECLSELKGSGPDFGLVKEDGADFCSKNLVEIIRAIIAQGAPLRLKVKGFSMSPFIRDGDILTISPLLNRGAGFGRPVAFIQPRTGMLHIHRVIGKSGGRYLIKGDNIPKPDGLFLKESILGYVSRIERNGRVLSSGLAPARYIIGLLSRGYLLSLLLFLARKFVRPVIKWFKTGKTSNKQD